MYLYATSSKGADWESSKYRLVKMISPPGNDRVGVTCVSICPMQKHLVVGNMRGIVYGIQLTDYSKIGDKVEFTHDFHAVGASKRLAIFLLRNGLTLGDGLHRVSRSHAFSGISLDCDCLQPATAGACPRRC